MNSIWSQRQRWAFGNVRLLLFSAAAAVSASDEQQPAGHVGPRPAADQVPNNAHAGRQAGTRAGWCGVAHSSSPPRSVCPLLTVKQLLIRHGPADATNKGLVVGLSATAIVIVSSAPVVRHICCCGDERLN